MAPPITTCPSYRSTIPPTDMEILEQTSAALYRLSARWDVLGPAKQQEYAEILRTIDDKIRSMTSNHNSSKETEDDGWMTL